MKRRKLFVLAVVVGFLVAGWAAPPAQAADPVLNLEGRDGSNAVPYDHRNFPVAAGSNRYLVVVLATYDQSPDNSVATTPTFGTIPMVELHRNLLQADPAAEISIWGCDEVCFSSATSAQVTTGWTNGQPRIKTWQSQTFQNVKQSEPLTLFLDAAGDPVTIAEDSDQVFLTFAQYWDNATESGTGGTFNNAGVTNQGLYTLGSGCCEIRHTGARLPAVLNPTVTSDTGWFATGATGYFEWQGSIAMHNSSFGAPVEPDDYGVEVGLFMGLVAGEAWPIALALFTALIGIILGVAWFRYILGRGKGIVRGR